MKFTKMQGIGNDYVYVNCFEEKIDDPAAVAVAISKPHYGIGSDGLILIGPSDTADFEMRIFNADGSEADMCGNGIRCVGKYVYERGLTDKTELTISTMAGLKKLWLTVEEGHVTLVRVDMGAPCLDPKKIPVALEGDMIRQYPLVIDGKEWPVTCVSMGNPHAVVFVEDPLKLDLPAIGPRFENNPVFPKRTNTEFIRVISRDELQMRVWERGACETLACGTGACASLVAAVVNGYADRRATLHLIGGDLIVEWNEEDGHVYQAGPAEFVFDGEWNQ